MLAVVPRNTPRRRRRPNLGPSWSYIQFIYGPWALFLDTKTRTHLTCFPCVIAHASTFFPAPSTFAGYASASAGTWTAKCSTDLCVCITWHPALCRFIAYLDQAYGCVQQHYAPTTSQLALATVLMLIEARCAALPHTLRCTDASKALCTANQ